MLLVEEAGGKITSADGTEFDLFGGSIVAASTQALHRELLVQLTPFYLQNQNSSQNAAVA